MIEINLVNILGIAVIGNMIAFWYTPIQSVKDRFIGFFDNIPLLRYPLTVLQCSKCASFVVSLIFFQDLLAAALTSLVGLIINFIIDYINNWYE